nr:MAG TPA: hypothetical protein [Caudoviricetes sp.]
MTEITAFIIFENKKTASISQRFIGIINLNFFLFILL